MHVTGNAVARDSGDTAGLVVDSKKRRTHQEHREATPHKITSPPAQAEKPAPIAGSNTPEGSGRLSQEEEEEGALAAG